jgi:hypothetical protein
MKRMIAGLGLVTAALAGSVHPASAAPARNVVLVHGAFTDETSWDKVARLQSSYASPVSHPADIAALIERAAQ